MRWLFSRRALRAPVSFLGLMVAAGPLVLTPGSSPPPVSAAEAAYRTLAPLPAGSSMHSRDGLESTAIALASSLGGVVADAEGGTCPTDDLVVRWAEPAGATIGAFVAPIGPAPTETTDDVNGIVACTTSTYGYMGFQASWTGDDWDIVDVPFVGGEDEDDQLIVQPPPAPPADKPETPVLATPGTVTGPIEGYAAYEPQRTCDPSAKPGTRALAAALLRDYKGSRNLGIVRGCSVGARSEHKEGRAFDWGVNITRPAEKAEAEAFIGALLATDAAGNKHALARRMGVMYAIWDGKIWSAYRAQEGWRPYNGASAHRDHVHISLSWAGAMGRTSFWSGSVPADLPTASAAGTRSSSSSNRGNATAHATRTRTHTHAPTTDTTVERERRHRWTPPTTVASNDTTDTSVPADRTVTTPTDGTHRHRRQRPPTDAPTTTTTPTTEAPSTTTTSTTAAPAQDASTTNDAVVADAPTSSTSTSTTVPAWRTGDGTRRHRRR
ncbi:MAG: hypothetical protein V7636_2784 [Actinomycetota bacterium]